MEQVTITIDEKIPYTGSAERPPEGDFLSDGVKYTSWDKNDFNTLNKGDTISITYTEKTNEFKGKTYINRNISKIVQTPQVINGREVEIIKIEDEVDTPNKENVDMNTAIIGAKDAPSAMTQIYNIGNLKYEVTLRLIS